MLYIIYLHIKCARHNNNNSYYSVHVYIRLTTNLIHHSYYACIVRRLLGIYVFLLSVSFIIK